MKKSTGTTILKLPVVVGALFYVSMITAAIFFGPLSANEAWRHNFDIAIFLVCVNFLNTTYFVFSRKLPSAAFVILMAFPVLAISTFAFSWILSVINPLEIFRSIRLYRDTATSQASYFAFVIEYAWHVFFLFGLMSYYYILFIALRQIFYRYFGRIF